MNAVDRNLPRILIVTESPDLASLLEGQLLAARAGDVRVTNDAREVLILRARWPFDLMIMDMYLRGVSPGDLMDVLSPAIDGRRLVVLALANLRDIGQQAWAISLGATDVIKVPFVGAQAVEQVRRALKGWRQHDHEHRS